MRTARQFTAVISAMTAVAAFSGPALAAWTKTYVVEWNEPAMYYGANSGVIDPGTDCPKGTNPEIDWIKVLMDAGYTREEAQWCAIQRIRHAVRFTAKIKWRFAAKIVQTSTRLQPRRLIRGSSEYPARLPKVSI